MTNDEKKFTEHHATQYTNIANDLRFYAEQRFKIVSVFLITNALLANVAKDHQIVLLGVLGVVLSYLCMSWERRTSAWWAILFVKIRELETLAIKNGSMGQAYIVYPRKTKWPFISSTRAVESIYALTFIGWLLFVYISWPNVW